MRKILAVLVVLFLLASFAPLFAEGGQEKAQGGEWKPPRGITFRTTSPGGTGYAEASAIGAAIKDGTGVNVATPPSDSTLGQLLPVKQGVAAATWFTGDEVEYARTGTNMFTEKGWGPQSMRMIWFGTPLPQGFATQKNSGIKTISDIVGRKLARVPEDEGDSISYKALFAYAKANPDVADLSYDNVKAVNVAGFDEGQTALLSGAVEVAVMSATSSTAHEMAASMNGLRWISLDYDTPGGKEGWKAWKAMKPYDIPLYANSEKVAAGVTKPEEAAYIFGWPFLVVGYDFQPSKELAYWIAKQFDVLHDKYQDSHPQLLNWTVKNMFNNIDGWTVPVHEGALAYFKEVGAWNDAAQAKQDELLKMWPNNTK